MKAIAARRIAMLRVKRNNLFAGAGLSNVTLNVDSAPFSFLELSLSLAREYATCCIIVISVTMSTDYDLDDTPSSLTDDSSARRIHVGERPRERRSLTRKTASLGRSKGEEERREYERFTEHSEYRRALFEEEDHDNRYRLIPVHDRGTQDSRSSDESVRIFVYERVRNVHLVNSRYHSVERERGYQNGEYSQDSEMESDPFVTWRPRRALPREYFIEIMVVADKKMVDYHGSGLISYILVLMSTVGTYTISGYL